MDNEGNADLVPILQIILPNYTSWGLHDVRSVLMLNLNILKFAYVEMVKVKLPIMQLFRL